MVTFREEKIGVATAITVITKTDGCGCATLFGQRISWPLALVSRIHITFSEVFSTRVVGAANSSLRYNECEKGQKQKKTSERVKQMQVMLLDERQAKPQTILEVHLFGMPKIKQGDDFE